MHILFTHQFHRQVKQIKDKRLAKNLEAAVLEVKLASNLSEISHLKKLKGSSNAYRIRLGDYRIDLYISEATIEFSCFMNRIEIYKYFP